MASPSSACPSASSIVMPAFILRSSPSRTALHQALCRTPTDRAGGLPDVLAAPPLLASGVHQLVAVELPRVGILRLRVVEKRQQVADRLLVDPQRVGEVLAVEVEGRLQDLVVVDLGVLT